MRKQPGSFHGDGWLPTQRRRSERLTGGPVSTYAAEAFLGQHGSLAVGRELFQAQRRLHIIRAADGVEPRHGHRGVDLTEQKRRRVSASSPRTASLLSLLQGMTFGSSSPPG